MRLIVKVTFKIERKLERYIDCTKVLLIIINENAKQNTPKKQVHICAYYTYPLAARWEISKEERHH